MLHSPAHFNILMAYEKHSHHLLLDSSWKSLHSHSLQVGKRKLFSSLGGSSISLQQP